MGQEGNGHEMYSVLPEGAKEVSPEAQEAISKEVNRRQLALLGKIIDRAVGDPAWKEKLLSDPQTAFDEGGFLPEIDALGPASPFPDDVMGQLMMKDCTTQYYQACAYSGWGGGFGCTVVASGYWVHY